MESTMRLTNEGVGSLISNVYNFMPNLVIKKTGEKVLCMKKDCKKEACWISSTKRFNIIALCLKHNEDETITEKDIEDRQKLNEAHKKNEEG